MSISKQHAFVKGLSFEIVSNFVGLGLAYLWFGDLCGCVLFTFVCFLVKTGVFVGHEKLWEG